MAKYRVDQVTLLSSTSLTESGNGSVVNLGFDNYIGGTFFLVGANITGDETADVVIKGSWNSTAGNLSQFLSFTQLDASNLTMGELWGADHSGATGPIPQYLRVDYTLAGSTISLDLTVQAVLIRLDEEGVG